MVKIVLITLQGLLIFLGWSEASADWPTARKPSKFYVGIVLPNEVPSGLHPFDLCQGEQCVKAGEAVTFGATGSNVSIVVDEKTHYITKYEVTKQVNEMNWQDKK